MLPENVRMGGEEGARGPSSAEVTAGLSFKTLPSHPPAARHELRAGVLPLLGGPMEMLDAAHRMLHSLGSSSSSHKPPRKRSDRRLAELLDALSTPVPRDHSADRILRRTRGAKQRLLAFFATEKEAQAVVASHIAPVPQLSVTVTRVKLDDPRCAVRLLDFGHCWSVPSASRILSRLVSHSGLHPGRVRSLLRAVLERGETPLLLSEAFEAEAREVVEILADVGIEADVVVRTSKPRQGERGEAASSAHGLSVELEAFAVHVQAPTALESSELFDPALSLQERQEQEEARRQPLLEAIHTVLCFKSLHKACVRRKRLLAGWLACKALLSNSPARTPAAATNAAARGADRATAA